MTADEQSLGDHVGSASSVLVVAPSRDPPDDEACADLLTRGHVAETNVLSVTLEATPDERLSVWQREHGGSPPERAAILDGGSGTQAASQAVATDAVPDVDVEVLSPDADLMDLGLSIATRLGEWAGTEEQTALCLHSLSAAIESYGADDVISLVNGLNDRCDRLGVAAHHHVDAAVDDETLAALRPLYDAVVEHAPDDGWIVTTGDAATTDPSFRSTTKPPGGVSPTDPDRPETVPIPYSFDTVLELVSAPRRRVLLYHLKDCEACAIDVDDLVDRVYEREQAVPVREPAASRDVLEASLVHVHLPKLDSAGLVDFDADESVVHYHGNPAVESCLDYVETLELG